MVETCEHWNSQVIEAWLISERPALVGFWSMPRKTDQECIIKMDNWTMDMCDLLGDPWTVHSIFQYGKKFGVSWHYSGCWNDNALKVFTMIGLLFIEKKPLLNSVHTCCSIFGVEYTALCHPVVGRPSIIVSLLLGRLWRTLSLEPNLAWQMAQLWYTNSAPELSNQI